MTATKTNEHPGTRAVHRYCGMSASKARQVLDLIRGQDVQTAAEILTGTEREAAEIIGKVLASAVANAAHNDQQNPEELYVSACYADEASTLKRWRPRARGRATRIRKRSCHITIIVSRMPDERLAKKRSERDVATGRRSRRVAESRRRADLSGRLSRRRAAHELAAEAEAEAEAEEELVEELETDEEWESTDEVTAEDDGADDDEDDGADEDEDDTDEEEAGAEHASAPEAEEREE
ncbi:MAG TPA: 50S ribosomal protein L22 [Candidatus Acidoferrales bacterium]|nr:50S ribosomal protein L22 [Candidatus Acidoferrales bacterium]